MALNQPDEDLVRHATEGDVTAFERLYRIHVGRINALMLRLSGNPQRAGELTQETFVQVWEKLKGFRGESSFATWLHRVAVNVALGNARASQRRTARVLAIDDVELLNSAAITAYSETRAALRLDLENAIAELPNGAREVFVLHDVEGYRHQEIAALTGVTTGTTRSQLHRARKLLKEILAP